MALLPVSREFYYLLKQSLLELRFPALTPSPALGGLWMASRDLQASQPRVLHLGSSPVHPCPRLISIAPLSSLRLLCTSSLASFPVHLCPPSLRLLCSFFLAECVVRSLS